MVSWGIPWKVRWEDRAADELRRLARRDQQMARRIGQAVTRLAETGHGDLTKLTSEAGEWRLRIGCWRIRFRFDEDANVIIVIRVLPRKDAYRD